MTTRSRACLRAAVLTLVFVGPATTGARERPEIVPDALILEAPYRYTGLLRSTIGGSRGLATGTAINQRVVLTAAHAVFDETTLRWATSAQFAPRHHQTLAANLPSGTPSTSLFTRWDAYQRAVETDLDGGIPSGSASYDTFNADVAALYFIRADTILVPGGAHAEAHVAQPAPATSRLRDPWEKLIIGYPAAQAQVPSANEGRQHRVGPGSFEFFWDGFEAEPSTHFDRANLWNALYASDDFRVFAGVSGGPVFVRDPDFDRWVLTAIVVGGSSLVTLVRSVDETIWPLIDTAATLSGTHRARRIETVEILHDPEGPANILTWRQSTAIPATVVVLRQEGDGWREIARVPEQAESFVDEAIGPGMRYGYTLQAVDPLSDGRRAPRSRIHRVSTAGSNSALGSALGAPLLTWSTDGDNAFRTTDAGARSGRIGSLQESILQTIVTGPGVLEFRWSVSSEENPDFASPGSAVEGEIYDALYFHINDRLETLISGEVADQTLRIPLSAGTHRLRWTYQKDPYADAGLDAGTVHAVDWQETGNQAFYGSFAIGGGFHYADWWGVYHHRDGEGWLFHTELGWLYRIPGPEGGSWLHGVSPSLGWFFTGPAVYPFVYLHERGWRFYVRGSGRAGVDMRFITPAP